MNDETEMTFRNFWLTRAAFRWLIDLRQGTITRTDAREWFGLPPVELKAETKLTGPVTEDE